MKRLSIALCILFTWAVAPASAQTPAGPRVSMEGVISPGDVTATPEMWFYEQYRRDYQDPKLAVRRRAEFRANQRQQRMAALKWFGFSNQRPIASGDPHRASWSPSWQSNNSYYPYRWSGVGRPWIILLSDIPPARTY